MNLESIFDLPFYNDEFNDFSVIYGLISNTELGKVTNGLRKVFPEIENPLRIYFYGSFFHFVLIKKITYTLRNALYLVDEEIMENVNYSSYIVACKNFELLKNTVNSDKKELSDFLSNMFNFLKQKFNQLDDINNEYDFFHYRDVFKNDALLKEMYNSVANPELIKYLDSESWKLYKILLEVSPAKDHVFLFNSLNKINDYYLDEENILSNFIVYKNYLNYKRFDLVSLEEPLNFFKKLHHDAWTNIKIKKYFS